MTQLIHSALPQSKRPIKYIGPDLLIIECVSLMTSEDIGALVVLENDVLIGILSERDIVRSCLNRGLDPNTTPAKDIVYKPSVLNINDPIEKAMEIITETKRRHVLVEDQGNVVAILSIGDILFYLLEDKTRTIEHLENYIYS